MTHRLEVHEAFPRPDALREQYQGNDDRPVSLGVFRWFGAGLVAGGAFWAAIAWMAL